jgi:DNA-binding NtrC family response regulator
MKEGLLEAAHGGTIFLDEIGELPPSLQAKLLRAVEVGQVTRVGAVAPISIDVRFIAATNRDLADEVAAGRFRADLFYRLDGVSLAIPPLRDRRGMIVPLALHFIAETRAKRGERNSEVSHAFLARLDGHDWPGNVRELKATVERAVLLAGGKDLSPQHLMFSKRVGPSRPATPQPQPSPTPTPPAPADLDAAALAERSRILEALDACAGNQTRAAKQLGMARATLTAKLALYRIPRPRAR